MSNRKTLRIACLHGYCQNSTVFRKKTGGLRKSLERSVNTVRAAVSYPALDTSDERDDGIPLAQLIYLDAPFVLEDKLLAAHSPPATRESDKFMTVFRPVVYAGNENGCSKEEDTTRRSWWAAEGDGKKYVGWEQSLQYIRDAFREQVSTHRL